MRTALVFTIVLVVLGAVTTSAFVARNPCQCSDIYKPVCGRDKQTYDNKCFMQCENVKLKHVGACGSRYEYDYNQN
ncbi:uncharacterized protein LOC142982701 [Anticarsia gemmatalis]|uniref:uncharacterized protein LOC142982701 n=1 Tax=Anticarsia gemmatalis TaxID=129554 RepID=UPI003F764823